MTKPQAQGELIPHVEAQAPAPANQPVSVLGMLDRAMSDKTVDVEKLSKLMDLYERVENRNAAQAFAAAMADAQKDMDPVRTNANNKATSSKYATYPALDKAIRPIYSRHGFAVTYGTGEGAPPDHLRVVATVMHRSGFSKDYHIDMPADGKGAKGGDVMTKTHATGSAFTYGKRYVLGGIFNIVVSDDDGNKAGETGELIGPDQTKELRSLLEFTNSDEAKFLKHFKLEKLEDMLASRYEKAVEAIKSQPGKK